MSLCVSEGLSINFERALLSINRLVAEEILHTASNSCTPLRAVEELIIPALERIGEGWEKGRVALSQVYMSGRICEELVDKILPPSNPRRKNQPNMAIAVLEDYHQLGKRIVYSVLRAAGFDLLDYGAGVPVDDLVNRVIADKIEVLLISVLMFPSALKVKAVKEKLSDTGVKVVVGGAPFLFDDQLWHRVNADAMGRNASEAIEIVTRLAEGMS